MRKLAAVAQEERQRQVVGLRESGLTFAAIAAQRGLTENGVSGICRRYAECGLAGLASGPRDPAAGTGRFVTAQQEAEVQVLVCRHLPDGLGLPYAMWSQRNPQDLRGVVMRRLGEQCCGVRLAVRSMGTDLARWGFTAQKPLRRAYKQSAEAVQRWLRRDYPAIVARAKREKGAIFWGDETGLRGGDVRGRSFAPRGLTPVVPPLAPAGQAGPAKSRSDLCGISAVANKGELRWVSLNGAVKAPALIRFVQRLVEDASRKVFLILNNLPVHRAHQMQEWLAGCQAEIEVFHLPAYSPDLNPDEGLNADLKQAATCKPPARIKDNLKRTLISTLRSLSKRPDRIRSYFGHPTFRHAV